MAIFRGTQSNNRLSGGAAGDLMYGYGGNDTLLGNNGNDTLYGDAGSDVLRGGAGTDIIYDNASEHTAANGRLNLHNILDGGSGNDTLTSRTTVFLQQTDNYSTSVSVINQELFGGSGNDRLSAEIAIKEGAGFLIVRDVQNIVKLDGGDGKDSLTLSATAGEWSSVDGVMDFAFQLFGGRGNDTLQLTVTGGAIETVKTLLDGGDGDDVIRALVNPQNFISLLVDTTVNGGTGNDDILLQLDPDTGDDFTAAFLTCTAGSGNDRVVVDAQAEDVSVTLDSGAGNDVVMLDIYATEGYPNVLGSAENYLLGGDGNDEITASLEAVIDIDSTIAGGSGNDTINVTAKNWSFPYERGHLNSIVFGNDGNDILQISLDADPQNIPVTSLLDGGTGNDTLTGSDLADTLVGGSGADQMTGGAGSDTFVLGKDTAGAGGVVGHDTVTDFTSGADHFDLGAFSLSLAGLQALLAASSGNTLALSTLGGRDVILAGLDVDDLATSDFIL